MKLRNITLLATLALVISSCEKLDQEPPIGINSDTLVEFDGPLNAAYYYQIGSVTPMAVMGDFRADNAYMEESPYDEFDKYTKDLIGMEDQFFGPFYTALYRSILSANNVIENSDDATEVGEAKFLRALSYFKLVRVFGGVTINTFANPDLNDDQFLARSSADEVYDTVIIPDLQDAINALGAPNDGRASKVAAEALLGKVYLQRGDFGNAEPQLANALMTAEGAGIELMDNYADVFSIDLNAEIIFATRISSSIEDEYGFSEFWSWSGGLDTKSLTPLDPASGPTIIAAFDENPGDLRAAVTVDAGLNASPKFPQSGGPDLDWIELRLADVMLMYAEASNENGASPTNALAVLDDLRTRAGLPALDPNILDNQDLVREAIAKERRLELAFEGHRWFDLVRTDMVDEAMGLVVPEDYHIFPIPTSEIFSSFEVITQNPGYE